MQRAARGVALALTCADVRAGAPGKFEITLHLKKGFDVQLLKKPIELALEDLLRVRPAGAARHR